MPVLLRQSAFGNRTAVAEYFKLLICRTVQFQHISRRRRPSGRQNRPSERNPNTDLFDINMGCPVEKVVRRGAGSALMKNPRRCGEIVRSVRRRTGIPVTAKIRLGQGEDSMNFMEVIAELEAAEVDAITVHARTRKQRYAGLPDYEAIRGLRREMSVPLVVSGNVFSLDDAIGYSEITGNARYEILMAQSKYDEALTQALKMNEYSPSPRTALILGDLYKTRYDDSTALHYYQEAVSMEPDYTPAYFGMAEIYRVKRDFINFFKNRNMV